MNKLHKLIIIAYFVCLSSSIFIADQQTSMGANPYTYSPQLFNAENGITGRYWAGNKKYPGKAYIEDIEYTNIIVIEKNESLKKGKHKLKKDAIYLGYYIDAATDQEYNLYGIQKYPDKINENPGADAITEIAMKEDIGPGE